MNQRLKKILLFIGILLVVLVMIFLVFRQQILQSVIGKIESKLDSQYGLVMKIQDARFSGMMTVSLKSILIFKPGKDTLVHVDTLSAHPSFWNLLKGNLRINELYCSDALIKVVNVNGISNYPSFHNSEKSAIEKDTSHSKRSVNLSLFLNEVSISVFNFAPQRAQMNNIQLTIINDSLNQSVVLQQYTADDGSFKGTIVEKGTTNNWICEGSFSQLNKKVDLTILSGTSKQIVPFLSSLAGLSIGFGTVHFTIDNLKYQGGKFYFNGLVESQNLFMRHLRISEDTVKIPDLHFRMNFNASNNSVTCDSLSVLALGKIVIHPFAEVIMSGNKNYSLQVRTDAVEGTDFFQSLPAGMFDEVRDVEASGTLSFQLNFNVDPEQPDSVDFSTSMTRNQFRLQKAGQLSKMNGEFIHQVYENGRYVRCFAVGPSNPDFTPYELISSNFKNAVLTSEDGNFFFHNGFNEDAFRSSIAANIKAHKFVRGGSTISMQLVKNVFLTRKKTIARKAEEALIVWLIESNRLTSKERMFEVYQNIIELGPNVYGIGEASHFYFNKKPAEITLSEGVFLASLLPHPKWFKYSFDKEGNLKPYLADYYRVVANFLLRKNLITPEQHEALQPIVELKGPAKEMVVPSDTVLTEQ